MSAERTRTKRKGPAARRGLFLVVAAGIGLFAAWAYLTQAPRSDNSVAGGASRADQSLAQAPESEFLYWDGRQGTLEDFSGKPMVVNFFASWCPPCLKELPDFEKVHRRVGDEIFFLGVNHEDAAEDGRRVVEQTGITFTTVRDPGGRLLRDFGGLAMPATAFVSKTGEVLEVHSGALTETQLEKKIEEHFR